MWYYNYQYSSVWKFEISRLRDFGYLEFWPLYAIVCPTQRTFEEASGKLEWEIWVTNISCVRKIFNYSSSIICYSWQHYPCWQESGLPIPEQALKSFWCRLHFLRTWYVFLVFYPVAFWSAIGASSKHARKRNDGLWDAKTSYQGAQVMENTRHRGICYRTSVPGTGT